MKTLWGSFLIRSPQGDVYFAGDTGFGPHFQKIYDRYGEIELALLPIGAYEPRWFMEAVHLDPLQAVKAHQVLHSQQSIGIHFGTFQLTYEGINEPEERLRQELKRSNISQERFTTLKFGETKAFTFLGHDKEIIKASTHE